MKRIKRLLAKWGSNIISKRIEKLIMNTKGSWKTTAAGWATLIIALAYGFIALVDGDPSTKIDMAAISEAFAGLGVALPVWLGFLFSRDNDKSSEDVSVKKRRKS